MKTSTIVQISLITLGCLTLALAEILQPAGSNQKLQGKLANREKSSRSRDESQNDLQEYRIVLVEPYKSLIQITTRQILDKANVSRHVDIDLAMTIINEVGYVLARPTVLLTTLEVVLASAGLLVGTTFLIPGAHKQVEHLWRNPAQVLPLNRYFPNGLSHRSFRRLFSLFEDELLDRLSLREEPCRKQIMCQIGEACRTKVPHFPESASMLIKSLKLGLDENKYVQAFQIGYFEQDCTTINADAANHTCLVDSYKNLVAHVKGVGIELRKVILNRH